MMKAIDKLLLESLKEEEEKDKRDLFVEEIATIFPPISFEGSEPRTPTPSSIREAIYDYEILPETENDPNQLVFPFVK